MSPPIRGPGGGIINSSLQLPAQKHKIHEKEIHAQQQLTTNNLISKISGDASYGAKGLKPLRFRSTPQIFV